MIAAFPLHIRKILRHTGCPNTIKTQQLCFFKWNLPILISFLDSMLNYEPNL
jgi:hypothetical protein